MGLDKMEGAEREVVGLSLNDRPQSQVSSGGGFEGVGERGQTHKKIEPSFPATDAAREWDGWGTALKPAVEDWWLCRKPLAEGTVAPDVLRGGAGGGEGGG